MTLTTLRLSKSGRRVSFRDCGTGDVIVLLHGVGMQSAAWTPQIAALCCTHRVVALDLPGHGGSDPLPNESQLPDFVAWCGEVLQALNLGPVNLIGHSMGALIALGVAVSHPKMVRRLAVLNIVFRRDADARAAVIARAADIQAGHIDLDTPLARWFDAGTDDATARRDVASWLNDVDRQGYATAYTAFAQGDATYAADLSDIACPFLALTGDGDHNSTPAMAKTMAKRAQNGRSEVIVGHRHMANLTAPEQVNAHLLAWLNMPDLHSPTSPHER